MAKVKFLETYTVRQFKSDNAVEALDIKESVNAPGKFFFTFYAGGQQVNGPLGSKMQEDLAAEGIKGIEGKEVLVSFVEGEVTEQNPDGKFWMLHYKGQGGAATVASL